ncbi:hypothetical protein PanWU01x14_017480 [Parasponia andersonii]|uniref:Uncharacterized protein n=1 Tax=Parasponia andersonii TaxID=3476 RepID=A0A2P5DZX4_PARAD|nr:hypothetical protein PanWU01x14_017480 [Parasponia andersonii]
MAGHHVGWILLEWIMWCSDFPRMIQVSTYATLEEPPEVLPERVGLSYLWWQSKSPLLAGSWKEIKKDIHCSMCHLLMTSRDEDMFFAFVDYRKDKMSLGLAERTKMSSI